jgi:hypothetical protein
VHSELVFTRNTYAVYIIMSYSTKGGIYDENRLTNDV